MSFSYLMLIPGVIALPGFIVVFYKTKQKERCPLYLAKSHLKQNAGRKSLLQKDVN